jgi:acyl carrier protein
VDDDDISSTIRRTIDSTTAGSVEVATLGQDHDLYAAGLKSLAAVHLMLALENAFGIEFPDTVLHRGSFSTVSRIRAIVAPLLTGMATVRVG